MKNIYTFLLSLFLVMSSITAIAQPSITTYDPAQNATNVAVDKILTLTFDENIEFNTDNNYYYVEIYKSDGTFIQDFEIHAGAAASGLTINNDNQLSIDANDFTTNTSYYVLIDADAVVSTSSGQGFAGLSNSSDWAFTTTSGFTITKYDPSQDETDVATTKILKATFNQNIAFNSSSQRFYIYIYNSDNTEFESYRFRNGSGPSNVTIDTDTLIIDATNDFSASSTYYVKIDSGLIQNSDASETFDGITSDTEWRFTTANPPAPPSISNYNPEQNSTTVNIDQDLVLTFNEDIKFNPDNNYYYVEIYKSDDTFIEDFEINAGSADNGLSVSGNQLTINPSSDFDYNTSYYVLIDADAIVSVSSETGFPGITSSSDWAFTTLATAPPTLSPENGAIDVSRLPTLTATFSDDITFEDNTTIQIYKADDPSNDPVLIDVGTGPSYGDSDSRFSISGGTFTIDLSNTLLAGDTTYIVYVPSDKLSVNGTYYNGFSDTNNPGWSFKTSLNPPAPLVQTYNPQQDATNVSIKQTLSLTFDRDIQPNQGGTTRYIRLFKNGVSTPVIECGIDNNTIEPNKGVSISNNILSITPTSDLSPNTEYYITIDEGAVESTLGVAFEGIDNSNTTWRFTTENPPVITNYSPDKNATEVPTDQTIKLLFDNAIVPNQNADYYYIKIFNADNNTEFLSAYSRNNSFESGKGVSINNDTLIIAPPTAFDVSTTYYLTIDYGAIQGTDGSTFAGIDNNTSIYQFTTVLDPPVITNLNPADLSIEIKVDTILSIEFNKNIQPNSGSATKYFTIINSDDASEYYQFGFQSGDILSSTYGTASISGNTLTVDVSSEFNINTNYYVKIDSGAIESVSTGDAFKGIDNVNTFWRFKTVTPPFWATDYPKIENLTDSNMDLYGMTQKSGNYYYIITQSSTVPTEDQIINGLDGDGNGALISGNGTMDINTVFSTNIDISGLTVSIDHYLFIVSQESAFNLYSSIEKLTFVRNVINTWTGTENSDFDNGNNWTNNSYEIYGSFKVPYNVPNYPVIKGDVQVHNIEVEAGAELKLSPVDASTSSSITATGFLSLGAGAKLTIESEASLSVSDDFDMYSSDSINASLLNNGSLTINGESRVHQAINANNRSYYICSPVVGATASSIGADLGIYYWDNSQNDWIAYSSTSSLQAARGYVIRSNNTELLFKGNLNNSDVTISVERNNDDDGEGWNLVGNPYPSAVDWDLVSTKENIFDGFWVFLNDQSLYGAYNAASGTAVNITNSIIPSNHAFWVRVEKTYSTGQVVFDNTSRVHNDTSYLKSATLSANPTLKLAGINGNYRDEIAIVFNDNATTDIDNYDSDKKFSDNNNFIQFYTTADNKELCINGLPLYNNDYTIPLCFNVQNAGTYTIKRIDYSNFPSDHTVLLNDLSENKTIDLIADGSYTFSTTSTGDITDRFTLTFKGDFATAITPKPKETKSEVYSYGKYITIKIPELRNASYKIYSINGQVIKYGDLGPNTTTTINIEKTGIYMVQVIYSGGVESQKVIIQ